MVTPFSCTDVCHTVSYEHTWPHRDSLCCKGRTSPSYHNDNASLPSEDTVCVWGGREQHSSGMVDRNTHLFTVSIVTLSHALVATTWQLLEYVREIAAGYSGIIE